MKYRRLNEGWGAGQEHRARAGSSMHFQRARARARYEMTKRSKERKNFTQRAALSEHFESMLFDVKFLCSLLFLLAKVALETSKVQVQLVRKQESQIENGKTSTKLRKKQKKKIKNVEKLLPRAS